MAITKNLAQPWIAADKHQFAKSELAGSGKGIAIVPSDTVDFTNPIKAVTVGGAGNIAFVNLDGTTETITVVAGQTLPWVAKRINQTGTTATDLTGYV